MEFYKRLVNRFLSLWKVAGEAGAKPRIKQFFEMIWLAGTCEFSPGEYWVYGFHLRDKDKKFISEYLPSKVYFSEVLPKFNNQKTSVFLENKWFFYLHFSRQLISTPHCYGVFHTMSGFLVGGEELRCDNDLVDFVIKQDVSSFVVKPLAGTSGKDIFKVKVDKSAGVPVFYLQGKELDAASLSHFLTSKITSTNNCGFLVQECVRQHKTLADLSPSACMNIRIVTIRRINGVTVVASASTRIGRLGSVVSNAGSGGMLARVEVDTGVIVKCRSSFYIDSIEIVTHPDTGVEILKTKIPFWRETLDLCLKAAELIPEVNSIGWDVLITDIGPILLEGNHDWDVISEQIFGEGFLTDQNANVLEEHGFKFNHSSPLSFRLGKVLQFVN